VKFITDYFRNRERNKIIKQISKLQEKSVQLQRNGNLREYAEVMKEIDELEKTLDISKNTPSGPTNQKQIYTDFVDYDGMGNQGRFPEVKNK
tara:strand:- start:5289 stop:5564 length:276 start_codon:yes stop_codon:yes gene_type:complete